MKSLLIYTCERRCAVAVFRILENNYGKGLG